VEGRLEMQLQGLLGEEETNKQLVLASYHQPGAEKVDLAANRAGLGLKNAVFFCRNNIKSGDAPLSNIALKVAKFSSLVKFISKDAGIKTSINQKFDEVALEELEALVMAHEEWGDEFVDKNVALYHGLGIRPWRKSVRWTWSTAR
jgi:hypothetical protein